MQSQVFHVKTFMNAPSAFHQFWKDIKAIAGPYWYPTSPGGRAFSDVIRAWGMLILLIFLIIAFVGVTAFESFVRRHLTDVIIQQKDYSKFIDTLLVYGVTLVLVTILVGASKFVRKKIALDWYEWLNNYILEKYLSNRAYYKINFISDLDNPDQRLSQEIEPITSNALSFSATFLEKVLEMATFLIILWSISQQVAVFLIIYTIIGNFIAIYLTQELNKINQEEL
ncbi:MAG: ABC transporter ATP-binding protein/permease, partial [Rhizonema sp. PD37]|nr:ABC transporter ATP-binding protein/permease [Rhizonema sp. PD37]